MSCPVCNGKGVVLLHIHDRESETVACPRCRPDAPGRLLKAGEGDTLEGNALAGAILGSE